MEVMPQQGGAINAASLATLQEIAKMIQNLIRSAIGVTKKGTLPVSAQVLIKAATTVGRKGI